MKHNVISSFKINMDGLIVDQALPQESIDEVGPFILLHHALLTIPANSRMSEFGVGPHPHRGFSPVTFVIKGGVIHQDSRGNYSEVLAGGVQWMNSAMGIMHSERPSHKLVKDGGEFEIIQLWINTPRKYKMAQPEYFPLNFNEIPAYNKEGVEVKIVSGTINEHKGPIHPKSPLNVAIISLEKEAILELTIDKHFETALYVVDGGIAVDDVKAFTKELVIVQPEVLSIKLSASAPSKVLFLSGLKIDEQSVKHGPFVMNSETEILQAMRDYQVGKMGILVEELD